MIKNTLRLLFTSLALVAGFVSFSNAQAESLAVHTSNLTSAATVSTATDATTTKKDFSAIKIGNFGQMDERFYRGAQPLESDYQALKDLGINTVIDLRNDPTEYEKRAVEALGMKYVNIPMSGWKSPKQKDVDTFLALVNNPETGNFYVHCKAGIHRTGVVGAAYRYTKYGWDYKNVYKEMKNYNYSNGLVHGALGSFVRDMGRRQPAKDLSGVEMVLTSPVTPKSADDDN
jgi:protein tyrosine/serine phosphatase